MIQTICEFMMIAGISLMDFIYFCFFSEKKNTPPVLGVEESKKYKTLYIF